MAVMVGYRHVTGTSKKTGKVFDAYVVSFLEEDTDAQGYGFKADQQFVDKALFERAVAETGKKPRELLDLQAQCYFSYNRNAFLEAFELAVPE